MGMQVHAGGFKHAEAIWLVKTAIR